jgi:hypothetical protein
MEIKFWCYEIDNFDQNQLKQMDYQRTQYGLLTYLLAFLAIVIPLSFIFQGKLNNQWQEVIFTIVLLPLIFLLFYKLTISVTREYIKVSFGIGIISFKVKPTKVLSTEIIHPKWWWGIGIRITPRGWLYNVAMGPAVLGDCRAQLWFCRFCK